MIEGINIKEVWNYRLSTATAGINTKGGTWVCGIFSKTNPDYVPAHMINQEFEQLVDDDGETYNGAPIKGTGTLVPATKPAGPVETHDTGIKTTKGDHLDAEKLKVCFEWFKSKRDKYSLPEIEELKPMVAEAERLQNELSEIQKGMDNVTARKSTESILKINEMTQVKVIAKEGEA